MNIDSGVGKGYGSGGVGGVEGGEGEGNWDNCSSIKIKNKYNNK